MTTTAIAAVTKGLLVRLEAKPGKDASAQPPGVAARHGQDRRTRRQLG
jgi:hypothetical protein